MSVAVLAMLSLQVSEEGVPRFAASLGEEVEPAMVEQVSRCRS